MKKRIILALALGALAVVLLIFNFTTPATVHPLGILIVFAGLYVLAFTVLVFLLLVGDKLRVMFFAKGFAQSAQPIAERKVYFYASALAFAPVAFTAMRSVGSNSFYDVLLIIFFEIIACFYIWRMA